MKYIGLELAANAVAMVFAAGAIVMAVNGIDGWGWIALCSLLTTGSVKWRSKDHKDNTTEP